MIKMSKMTHFATSRMFLKSARIDVDGKMLGVHDMKPGMKVQKTTITTTTPKVVTTVQTVSGKVWYADPPNSVILTLEDGTNQKFHIPKGQMFNVNGQMVDAFGLKRDMTVTATRIVEVPTVEGNPQTKTVDRRTGAKGKLLLRYNRRRLRVYRSWSRSRLQQR